jgi:hypothetical protein
MPKAKKGGGFERDFCKFFSKWWSEGERDDIFWRSSQSGGRATIRKRKGLETAGSVGDMCALDESGLLFVDNVLCEMKRGYNGMDVYDIIDFRGKKPNLLDQWLENLEQQKRNHGKKTFWLVLRRDRRQISIIMPTLFLSKLEAWNGRYKNVLFSYSKRTLNRSYAIMNGEEFFEWLNPQSLSQLILDEKTY